MTTWYRSKEKQMSHVLDTGFTSLFADCGIASSSAHADADEQEEAEQSAIRNTKSFNLFFNLVQL